MLPAAKSKTVRDEHYDPFRRLPPSARPLEAVTVFVMARQRIDQTDSMRGSLSISVVFLATLGRR
jgi:hypothetical protein